MVLYLSHIMGTLINNLQRVWDTLLRFMWVSFIINPIRLIDALVWAVRNTAYRVGFLTTTLLGVTGGIAVFLFSLVIQAIAFVLFFLMCSIIVVVSWSCRGCSLLIRYTAIPAAAAAFTTGLHWYTYPLMQHYGLNYLMFPSLTCPRAANEWNLTIFGFAVHEVLSCDTLRLVIPAIQRYIEMALASPYLVYSLAILLMALVDLVMSNLYEIRAFCRMHIVPRICQCIAWMLSLVSRVMFRVMMRFMKCRTVTDPHLIGMVHMLIDESHILFPEVFLKFATGMDLMWISHETGGLFHVERYTPMGLTHSCYRIYYFKYSGDYDSFLRKIQSTPIYTATIVNDCNGGYTLDYEIVPAHVHAGSTDTAGMARKMINAFQKFHKCHVQITGGNRFNYLRDCIASFQFNNRRTPLVVYGLDTIDHDICDKVLTDVLVHASARYHRTFDTPVVVLQDWATEIQRTNSSWNRKNLDVMREFIDTLRARINTVLISYNKKPVPLFTGYNVDQANSLVDKTSWPLQFVGRRKRTHITNNSILAH